MYPAYNYRSSYRRPSFYRRSRPGQVSRWVMIIIAMCAVLVSLTALISALGGQDRFLRVLFWWSHHPDRIVRAGLPLWAGVGVEGHNYSRPWPGLGYLTLLTQVVQKTEPLQMITLQLPVLAAANLEPEATSLQLAPVVAPGPALESEEKLAAPVTPISEENLVAIYNTHTGETYALTDGMERLNGKRGGVVKVAATLEQELEERHGIKVARSDTIHDAIYNNSYARSQETLRGLLEDNPAVQVVLDIHRDAGISREKSLVTVDGQQVAPVLIVVGSDARAPFPAWRQNHNFAQELAAEINRQYPGLCLGVRVYEGRYNQFLHPRAVLLEVGSVSNSTEEAVRTGRLLASPVAEMVKRCLDAESSSTSLRRADRQGNGE